MIEQLINNHVIRMAVTGIVAVIVLTLLIRLIKKARKKKELRIIAEDKMREDMLDGMIQNSYAGKNSIKNISVPYEVDYSQANQKSNRLAPENRSCFALQLIEHNQLSMRKHMVNLEKSVRIGSMTENNTIIVPEAAPCQCEVFQYKDGVYIRNVSSFKSTQVKRGKVSAYVDNNGTKLQSGDKIIIGKIYFDVKIIR